MTMHRIDVGIFIFSDSQMMVWGEFRVTYLSKCIPIS